MGKELFQVSEFSVFGEDQQRPLFDLRQDKNEEINNGIFHK